jgi:hypothetical protein
VCAAEWIPRADVGGGRDAFFRIGPGSGIGDADAGALIDLSHYGRGAALLVPDASAQAMSLLLPASARKRGRAASPSSNVMMAAGGDAERTAAVVRAALVGAFPHCAMRNSVDAVSMDDARAAVASGLCFLIAFAMQEFMIFTVASLVPSHRAVLLARTSTWAEIETLTTRTMDIARSAVASRSSLAEIDKLIGKSTARKLSKLRAAQTAAVTRRPPPFLPALARACIMSSAAGSDGAPPLEWPGSRAALLSAVDACSPSTRRTLFLAASMAAACTDIRTWTLSTRLADAQMDALRRRFAGRSDSFIAAATRLYVCIYCRHVKATVGTATEFGVIEAATNASTGAMVCFTRSKRRTFACTERPLVELALIGNIVRVFDAMLVLCPSCGLLAEWHPYSVIGDAYVCATCFVPARMVCAVCEMAERAAMRMAEFGPICALCDRPWVRHAPAGTTAADVRRGNVEGWTTAASGAIVSHLHQ